MALTDEKSLALGVALSETPRPLFPARRIGAASSGGQDSQDKKHRTQDFKRRLRDLRKANEFKRKLQDQFSAVQSSIEATQQEFLRWEELINSQSPDQVEDMSGMTPKQVKELLADYKVDFSTAAAKEQPKPALISVSGTSGDMSKSTKQEGSDEPLHRTAQPQRSALRRPGVPLDRERKRGRLSFAGEESFVNKVTVTSYLNSAADLWFTMPNAIVCCDQCQTPTPHSLGSMIGAWGRSRFAQGEFLCAECLLAVMTR